LRDTANLVHPTPPGPLSPNSCVCMVISLCTWASVSSTWQWHSRALGRPWRALPGWVMLVEYGCLTVYAAIVASVFTAQPVPEISHWTMMKMSAGRPAQRLSS